MATSNQTLAKNTMFLYIGTLANLLISLYTSRVVLNTLGVVDYGIYSIVGSVISMVTIINLLMINATSRFLSIEIGRNDAKRLADTFSSAMIGQIFLALIVVVLLETIGIYMLNNKLVIPSDRIFAAHTVFQLSIISMFITTTQQPYNAAITAREHFGVYTVIDILNTTLKLIVVFLLVIGDFDKLILYAILLLAVTIIITLTYRIYCIIHFPECRIKWHVEKDILISMLKYSSWTMLGSTLKTYSIQGSNLILNMFFGPVLNAANGIAMTVEGSIMGFSYNAITAFRFQIVKAYAANELKRMCELIYNASRYSTALFLLVTIPVFLECNYVLKLWLGQVPEYTLVFVRLLLMGSIARMNVSLVGISIGATPNVRNLNILNSILYFSQLPIVYILFKEGATPSYLYIVGIFIQFLALFTDMCILRRLIADFSARLYIYSAFLKNIPLLVISSCCLFYIQTVMDEGFLRLSLICVTNVVLFGSYFYAVVLNKEQRQAVIEKIKNKIKNHE